MTLKDKRFDLKKLHVDFVKNKYFSAFSLMTPKENWLSIDKKEHNIKRKIRDARQKKIFNIVVEEEGQVIGSINVKDIDNNKWGNYIKSIGGHQVDASTALPKLSEMMVKDSEFVRMREDSLLYFVIQSKNMKTEPIGIMTFWDLNRAPLYIFSYMGLVYLEQTLLLKIRESNQNWCDHSAVIAEIFKSGNSNGNKSHIKKFVKEDHGIYNYIELSKCGIIDLLAFYKFDEHLDKTSFLELENLVDLFYKPHSFRNKIAHSIELLVDDDDNFKYDLKSLNEIGKYGKQAFLDFTDPKVSRSTPLLGDF